MGWLNILPLFLLLWQADMYLWVLSSVLPLKSYQYLLVLIEIFCTRLPLLTKPSNCWGSWMNDLSSLWYISEIMPSWNREFSSKLILISGLIFVLSDLCELSSMGVLIGLGGACKLDLDRRECLWSQDFCESLHH